MLRTRNTGLKGSNACLTTNGIWNAETLIAFVYNNMKQNDSVPSLDNQNIPTSAVYVSVLKRVARQYLCSYAFDIDKHIREGEVADGYFGKRRYIYPLCTQPSLKVKKVQEVQEEAQEVREEAQEVRDQTEEDFPSLPTLPTLSNKMKLESLWFNDKNETWMIEDIQRNSKSSTHILDIVDDDLKCPLTGKKLIEPVCTVPDGMIFEKNAILTHLRQLEVLSLPLSNPITNTSIQSVIVPQFFLQSVLKQV